MSRRVDRIVFVLNIKKYTSTCIYFYTKWGSSTFRKLSSSWLESYVAKQVANQSNILAMGCCIGESNATGEAASLSYLF